MQSMTVGHRVKGRVCKENREIKDVFTIPREWEFKVDNGVGISLVDIARKRASARAVSSETVSRKIALDHNKMPRGKLPAGLVDDMEILFA
jgi:hypothetical protein